MAYNIKNVKMPSYHSIYENVCKLQKIFLIRVFWLKFTFPIKFIIRILDLMLLPKNSVPFEGQYYSSTYISNVNSWDTDSNKSFDLLLNPICIVAVL